MNRSKSAKLLFNFFSNFIVIFFLILIVNAQNFNNNDGFNLFISKDEINRTLGK